MIEEPKIIDLPKVLDRRGNLSFIEQEKHVPFQIKRTYWIYDVPGGESRGGHAYKRNKELLVALSGSFDVVLTDGIIRIVYSLNRSYFGLYVPAGWWREMNNFSTNSFCMILSSESYSVNDYVRDYDEYLKLKSDGTI